VSDLHQFTLQKDLPEDPRFLTAENCPPNGGSLFRCSLSKPGAGQKSLNAVTALTRNGHTMTRYCLPFIP
jgi:hypothetical protein